MTNTELKKILNKTSWTGEELGRLEIKVMADLCEKDKQGKPTTPLIPLEQLQSMVYSITDEEEGAMFNNFHAIYQWIYLIRPCAEAMQQQAFLSYQILEKYFRTSILAEDVYRYASSLPLILTQAQYDKEKAERVEKYTSKREDSLAFMLLRALSYYTKQLEKNPKAKNPLSPLKKKYSQEKITSHYIKEAYNMATGNGYYQLEDGRRSDQMSPEEWQKTVHPELHKALEYMDNHNGERSPEAIERTYYLWSIKNAFLLNGYTEKEAERYIEQEDIQAGRSLQTTWHYYKEAPETLTKWELVTDPATLWSCYSFAFSVDCKKEDYLAELQDFLKEFKELVSILIKDIDKTCLQYFKFAENEHISSLLDIPLEKWRDYRISTRELYNRNIYGFKDELEEPKNLFRDNQRALFNGVAIAEKEDFKEPSIESAFKEYTLEGFFTENPDYAFNTANVNQSIRLIYESYYYVRGYNKLLDMIADYYKLKDVLIFKCSAEETLVRYINTYNNLIPTLYGSINDNFYLDNELKKRKLEALRDNFTPIDLEKIELKEETLKEVKKGFKDFKAFRTGITSSGSKDWLAKRMCVLPAEYREAISGRQ